MATGTLPERPRAAVEPERFIEQQLRRTQRQVRAVDLAAALAMWLVGLVATLLVLVICDHWLISIGSVGRWLSLFVLVAGTGWYFATQLGPLVMRRINSAYAAKVIEDAEPSLKNSLLNFLLLRNQSAAVPEVVVAQLRSRAAADLSHTSIDHAVDRAPLIRLGYVLCGMVVLFGVYKLLSPKDPFRTVARVLAPWSHVAKASRVQILNLKPEGVTDVYQGQTIQVTAEVHGIRSGENVEVVYSTADGQIKDAVVAMSSDSRLHFAAPLPPESAEGIQQDIVFHVRAGDAESPENRLHVLPSPRINVDRVELHYPPYTKREPQTLNQGDVRAVEGTQAIIHAKANQPINSAWIEFDPAVENSRRHETLSLKASGDMASGSFRLERLADGNSRQTSYQVRLTSENGLTNDRPTLHRIEAVADLAPEISVLSPMERRVELPADRTLKVEVRGRDPDFGLCKISLELSVGPQAREPVVLFDHEQGQPGPATVSYVLSPKKLDLEPGDELIFAAVARDNRHDARGELTANISRTDRYVVVITAPEARNSPEDKTSPGKTSTDTASQNNPDRSADQPENSGNNSQEKKPQDTQGKQPSEKNEPSATENKQPMNSAADPMEQEKSEAGKKGEEEDSGNSGKQQQAEGAEGGSGDQSEGAEGQQEQQNQSSGGSEGQSGSKQQGGAGEGGASSQQEGDGGENDDGAGDAASDSQSSSRGKPGKQEGRFGNSPGSESNGEQGGSDNGDDSQGTPDDASGKGAREGNSPSGTSKPKHDGEAFERLEQLRKEQQATSGNKSEGSNTGESADDSAAADAQEQTENKASSGDKRSSKAGQGAQSKPMTGAQASNAESGEGQTGEKPEQENPMSGASGEQSPEQGTGEGSNKPGTPRKPESTQAGENATSSKPGQGDQGDPGSAQKPKQPNPTGEPQVKSQDREKTPKGNEGESNEEASAPSKSKKQSDSTGGASGDQSGGGNQGAGQQGKGQGKDTPGTSTSSDDGNGQSEEQGEGETGSKAGQGTQAKGKTGESGNDEGPGSKSKPGENGSKPSPNENGAEGGGNGQKGQAKPQSKSTEAGASSGQVTGGGKAAEGDTQLLDQPPREIADTEAANLEYAKRSTDLALKYLKDQKDNPDPELLKRMGWTKDELQAFVERWESLKKSAVEDTADRAELDDAYRSLGLRPAADQRRTAGKGDDAIRGNRDSGARSEPPPGYAEQFKAFRKGAGRK